MNSEFRTYSGDDAVYPINFSMLSAPQSQTPTPKSISPTSGWQYVEYPIHASSLIGSNWYIRAWIGNPTGVLAYLDDIRIYPKDAIVSTYYYDHKLGKPLCIVDANSKAKKYEYDDFGRLTALKNNAGQTLTTTQYKLGMTKKQNIKILSPKGENHIESMS